MSTVMFFWPRDCSSVNLRPDEVEDPGLMVQFGENAIVFTFDYREEHARFHFMDFLEALCSESKKLIAKLEDGSCIPLPFTPSPNKPLPDQPVADQ